MRKPALLVLALSALALFFGWQAWQALDAPIAAYDNSSRGASTGWHPAAPASDPPPPPDTALAVAAVKTRPLFRADRRPFTDVAGTASGRNFDAELSRLTLIGILAIGDDQKAIVVSKGGPRSERWEVKAGDELPGFKVKEVRTDGLTVSAEDREFLLPLYAGAPTTTGGSVRTEGQRQPPATAQPAAAPSAQPKPSVALPAAPQPAPSPAPGVPPRYIPGRRAR